MSVNPNSLKNLEKGAPHRFNKETAAAAGRKGNPKSQEVRKQNRSMAQYAKTVSESEIQNDDAREDLRELGITEEYMQNVALIVGGVFRNAAAGNILAVDKWEQLLERAANEENGALDREQVRALAIMRANYLPNISSNFGAISVCALKHKYTHYEASGGRGSLKSSWASLTVVRLIMEYPDAHALVLRKVVNTMRDSVYAQYVWAIGVLGVADFWEARRSPLELIYKPPGQRILFRGADDPMKIKSINHPSGAAYRVDPHGCRAAEGGPGEAHPSRTAANPDDPCHGFRHGSVCRDGCTGSRSGSAGPERPGRYDRPCHCGTRQPAAAGSADSRLPRRPPAFRRRDEIPEERFPREGSVMFYRYV